MVGGGTPNPGGTGFVSQEMAETPPNALKSLFVEDSQNLEIWSRTLGLEQVARENGLGFCPIRLALTSPGPGGPGARRPGRPVGPYATAGSAQRRAVAAVHGVAPLRLRAVLPGRGAPPVRGLGGQSPPGVPTPRGLATGQAKKRSAGILIFYICIFGGKKMAQRLLEKRLLHPPLLDFTQAPRFILREGPNDEKHEILVICCFNWLPASTTARPKEPRGWWVGDP